MGTLAEPVSTMLNFMRLYEEGKAGFIRFMDMMELVPSVAEKEHPVELPEPRGEIVFDHVSFSYEKDGEKVLEDLSFRIEPGTSVAFAGASGIGKTTISMLLARFYDVTAGASPSTELMCGIFPFPPCAAPSESFSRKCIFLAVRSVKISGMEILRHPIRTWRRQPGRQISILLS